MPVFHSSYTPNRGPKFNPRANILTIAYNQKTKKYTELVDFTNEQKIATFELILSLGLRAAHRPPDHLRDSVDLSHVLNKDDRRESERYTSVLMEGTNSLVENSEDGLVWSLIYRDTDTSKYFHTNQGAAVIEDHLYYRIPGRFARISSPLFVNASNLFLRDIARLLPEFLNEKKRRVGWTGRVERTAPDSPFNVTVRFPPNDVRRPGLQAPGGDQNMPGLLPLDEADNDDDAFSDTSFTSEDWRQIDAASEAALNNDQEGKGKGRANDAPHDDTEEDDPTWKGKERADITPADGAEDHFFTPRANRDVRSPVRQQEAVRLYTPSRGSRSSRINVDDDEDDEDHAHQLRAAITASQETYAQQLMGIRELSVEPIPSTAQAFPAQHMDRATGTTVHGTFVPHPMSPTPSSPRLVSDAGTWFFVPGQSSLILPSSQTPRTPPRETSSKPGPSKMQKSSSSSKKRGPGY